MEFILFGAGDLGNRALRIIGSEFVSYYVDNSKSGGEIMRKKIISFEEMMNTRNDEFVVITSENYADEMEAQLIDAGIHDYFFFSKRYDPKMNECLPKYNYMYNVQYMNYTDILLNYRITDYKRIVIYGVNKYLDRLLFEIAIISNLHNVYAIIGDDDVDSYYGIPNKHIDEIEDADCIIINAKRTESGIRENPWLEGKAIVDIYDVDKFIHYNQYPNLVKYKDIYKGQRVFIVGNGPSVQLDDLEVLYKNNEICFGMNKISKVFSQVSWRPNYICMTDSRVIMACEKNIDRITECSELIVGDRYIFMNATNTDKINYVHLKSEYYSPNMPGFSDDVTTGVYWGYSVTYDIAIQFAAYMGAKEIFLIGIDNNNVGTVTDERNHFIKDYFDKDEQDTYKNVVADFDAMTLAYKKAEMYSRAHGFRIYNATRGGKLEVFERVDFDSLFSDRAEVDYEL